MLFVIVCGFNLCGIIKECFIWTSNFLFIWKVTSNFAWYSSQSFWIISVYGAFSLVYFEPGAWHIKYNRIIFFQFCLLILNIGCEKENHLQFPADLVPSLYEYCYLLLLLFFPEINLWAITKMHGETSDLLLLRLQYFLGFLLFFCFFWVKMGNQPW